MFTLVRQGCNLNLPIQTLTWFHMRFTVFSFVPDRLTMLDQCVRRVFLTSWHASRENIVCQASKLQALWTVVSIDCSLWTFGPLHFERHQSRAHMIWDSRVFQKWTILWEFCEWCEHQGFWVTTHGARCQLMKPKKHWHCSEGVAYNFIEGILLFEKRQ